MFILLHHMETAVSVVRENISTSHHVIVEIRPEEPGLSDGKTKSKGTYDEIKNYVLEKYGLSVSTLYISQVKRKCGLDVGETYMKPKNPGASAPQCPPDKEKATRDALKHFGMIK